MSRDPNAAHRSTDPTYYGTVRHDLLSMLPAAAGLRLLELGAGDGTTLREAKRRGIAAYVAGIDLVTPPAGTPAIDHFLSGDVEAMELDLPPASFDAVMAGDVLEHLADPWTMVRRLAGLLRPGGVFIASIPNIRNHRALAPLLLHGDFRYDRAGILDRTHLRFFCRRNAEDLLRQAGLRIEAVEENMGAYGVRHRTLDALTLRLFHDFFVFQFRLRAVKAPAP
jgi:2-polyprenyl-3-methyl-5-hydroxy-6-metoxy-1,4-benzoquinol methylase